MIKIAQCAENREFFLPARSDEKRTGLRQGAQILVKCNKEAYKSSNPAIFYLIMKLERQIGRNGVRSPPDGRADPLWRHQAPGLSAKCPSVKNILPQKLQFRRCPSVSTVIRQAAGPSRIIARQATVFFSSGHARLRVHISRNIMHIHLHKIILSSFDDLTFSFLECFSEF